MEYIGDLPEDFNPDNNYNYDYKNDEWDFKERESLESHEVYKSNLSLNLRKMHPK